MDADLLIRAARAVSAADSAAEEAYAADEAHSTPENAAARAWDASSLLRDTGERFIALADAHKLAAMRYDREAKRELATGVEYRLTPKDAA